METIDDFLGWNAHSADEERGPALDDHVNELWQLAVGVVVLCLLSV